jgi:hypothetical protein
MIYLYVLVAIALTDNPGTQTIGYYSTIGECHIERNRMEKKIDKSYVKLDCIPLKVN